MNAAGLTQLQTREVFHLEFLRRLGHSLKPHTYALKGGTNLRFFFNSPRFSEDMDIDVVSVPVSRLQDIVMETLSSPAFHDIMATTGIVRISAPDLRKAKQTETTQRFKIHLTLSGGLDLLTKVEFSRRGFTGKPVVEGINPGIVREYRTAPLLAPHYPACAAVLQKISALADRTSTQARDIFDLHILLPHCTEKTGKLSSDVLTKARENIFAVDFEQFRDTVVEYLAPEDRMLWSTPAAFDEIRLRATMLLEEMQVKHD